MHQTLWRLNFYIPSFQLHMMLVYDYGWLTGTVETPSLSSNASQVSVDSRPSPPPAISAGTVCWCAPPVRTGPFKCGTTGSPSSTSLCIWKRLMPRAQTPPPLYSDMTTDTWPPGLTTKSFSSVFFSVIYVKYIDLPGGQINGPLSGKYFSLPLLPATPLSLSMTLEGLFEPLQGSCLASCVASRTTEEQGHCLVCHVRCRGLKHTCQGKPTRILIVLVENAPFSLFWKLKGPGLPLTPPLPPPISRPRKLWMDSIFSLLITVVWHKLCHPWQIFFVNF